MSMSDILTEIQYGASVAVEADRIKDSKIDIIKLHKDRAAEDLGRKIMASKGWTPLQPIGNLAVFSQTLYVFKRSELMLYTDAKIKQKLIEMADRPDVPDDVKPWLKILSERV